MAGMWLGVWYAFYIILSGARWTRYCLVHFFLSNLRFHHIKEITMTLVEAEFTHRLVWFHIQLLNYRVSQLSQPASDVKAAITLMPQNAECLGNKLKQRFSVLKMGKALSLTCHMWWGNSRYVAQVPFSIHRASFVLILGIFRMNWKALRSWGFTKDWKSFPVSRFPAFLQRRHSLSF